MAGFSMRVDFGCVGRGKTEGFQMDRGWLEGRTEGTSAVKESCLASWKVPEPVHWLCNPQRNGWD